MRVGILTSHRVPCGIAEYSNRLAEGFRAAGAEPVILAGRADEHRSVPEETDFEVHDVAQIGLWRDDGTYWLEYETIHGLDLDVIHVQYQSMLFHQEALLAMATAYRGQERHPVYAITFHDSCNRHDFPAGAFDLRFTHRHGVGVGDCEVIPFGIENRPPVVRTFGLGRTRADLIGQVCELHGWVFETAASHEPIHGGGQAWRSHDELIEWLRGADAIVLWYDDVAQAGSSQAARTALASRRPVIVNDTTWFSDLPQRSHGCVKVSTLGELEGELRSVLDAGDYVRGNSWENVARLLLERYERAAA